MIHHFLKLSISSYLRRLIQLLNPVKSLIVPEATGYQEELCANYEASYLQLSASCLLAAISTTIRPHVCQSHQLDTAPATLTAMSLQVSFTINLLWLYPFRQAELATRSRAP